jgi:hypothetical protein
MTCARSTSICAPMRRRLALSLALTAAFAAAPAGALAADAAGVREQARTPQEQGRQPQGQQRRPKGKPEPTGRIGVRVTGAYEIDGRTVAVTGRELRITGRIVPAIPGQKVSVRIWRGRTLIKERTVQPQPTSTGKTATFSVRFTPERSGDVRIFALHEETPEQRRLLTEAKLTVVSPVAGAGARGPFVALLQQQLARLGYAVPRNGVYDDATGRAILAFRKVNGMARVTSLDGAVVDRLLRGVGGFKVRYPQHGRHVEANLTQQVLALIENGRVVRADTTSAGAAVTPTVLGNYRFYWKDPGTNAKGMVHSAYFIRGYAIHGYASVPTYPASHGCLRIPIPDALSVFNWVRIGDQIDVYY